MFERHRELRTNIGVTAIAELNLSLGKQKALRFRAMNRVAIRAHDTIQRMRGICDVHSRCRLPMAAEACIHLLSRRYRRKGHDLRLIAMALDMRASGPVTAFASGRTGRLVSGSVAQEVRVLVEVSPDVGMTCTTSRASDERGLRRRNIIGVSHARYC